MRILIAEDEAGIAKALKVILEKNKFSADVVYNGTDALDYITNSSYDAVVLDANLPEDPTGGIVIPTEPEDPSGGFGDAGMWAANLFNRN